MNRKANLSPFRVFVCRGPRTAPKPLLAPSTGENLRSPEANTFKMSQRRDCCCEGGGNKTGRPRTILGGTGRDLLAILAPGHHGPGVVQSTRNGAEEARSVPGVFPDTQTRRVYAADAGIGADEPGTVLRGDITPPGRDTCGEDVVDSCEKSRSIDGSVRINSRRPGRG